MKRSILAGGAFALLILIGPSANAQESYAAFAETELERCWDEGDLDYLERIDCTEDVRRAAIETLSQRVDTWAGRTEAAGWRRGVRQAQDAWVASYRADCAGFIETSGAGGSGSESIRVSCEVRHVASRIDFLRAMGYGGD